MAKTSLIDKIQNRASGGSINFLSNSEGNVFINLTADDPLTDLTNIAFNAATLIKTEDVIGVSDSANISIQTGTVVSGTRGNVEITSENTQVIFPAANKKLSIIDESANEIAYFSNSSSGYAGSWLVLDGNATYPAAAILLDAHSTSNLATILFTANSISTTTGTVGYRLTEMVLGSGVNVPLKIETDNAPSGNSGNITLITGTASGTRGNISLDGNDISFNDQYLSSAINVSESGETGLDGAFSAISIVGALNELKGDIQAGEAEIYSGTVAATNGATTQIIAIGSDLGTTNYSPNVIMRNNSGDPFINVMITVLTSSTFTIKYSSPIPTGNYYIDWIVAKH